MDTFWNKYASLAIRVGVNLQEGEILCIRADLVSAPLVRELVAEAYRAGADRVEVIWRDDIVGKTHYTLGGGRVGLNPAEWEVAQYEYMAQKKVCYINVLSGDPELFADVDPDLLTRVSRARRAAAKPFNDAANTNVIKWCLFAYPDAPWAVKISPDLDEAAAIEHLKNLIAHAMRLDTPDPVAAWQRHDDTLRRRADKLNELGLVKLRYSNSLGTDLTLRLPKGYVFAGGCDVSSQGVAFNPNMPTEEIFSAPDKYGVDGVVYASMPLFHNGARVEDFGFRFEGGRIVDYWAKKGLDILKGVIDTDSGSCYLGEVALVPYDSPIQNLHTLFLETLFDENASCHLAIGSAYPSCVEGGLEMSKEQLEQAGINVSDTHVDFMIGTKDLRIDGYLADGSVVPIFVDGNFAF